MKVISAALPGPPAGKPPESPPQGPPKSESPPEGEKVKAPVVEAAGPPWRSFLDSLGNALRGEVSKAPEAPEASVPLSSQADIEPQPQPAPKAAPEPKAATEPAPPAAVAGEATAAALSSLDERLGNIEKALSEKNEQQAALIARGVVSLASELGVKIPPRPESTMTDNEQIKELSSQLAQAEDPVAKAKLRDDIRKAARGNPKFYQEV